jgi:hypothetical protein
MLAIAVIAIAVLLFFGVFNNADAASKWPYKTFQVGLLDPEHDAVALRQAAPVGLRYQYLSGGVNTGHDWITWDTGSGSFVVNYVAESVAAGFTPVFSYYELEQSMPGAPLGDGKSDLVNLRNRATMTSYFSNLRTLMDLLGSTGQTVVLHVEPDLWGYVQQSVGDDASKQPVPVASTGLPELQGLPNNMTGFAQAVVRLRNRYAPKVLLGYHLSVFGTGKDIHYSPLSNSDVDWIAKRAGWFYRSLHSSFDTVFAEYTNSDAGYFQTVYHTTNALWNADDYARHVRFLGDFHKAVKVPMVLWQIPVGNTLYRADNNTYGHYQDNKVQWLLGTGWQTHLRSYINAGVVAMMFGGGLPASTCACDAVHDGVTNPAPINGNTRASLSADDDGGYLKARVRAYYSAKLLALP